VYQRCSLAFPSARGRKKNLDSAGPVVKQLQQDVENGNKETEVQIRRRQKLAVPKCSIFCLLIVWYGGGAAIATEAA